MKSYFLLLKNNTISYLGNFKGASLRKDNGKLDVSRLILYIVAVLSLVMVAGMLVYLELSLYKTAATAGDALPEGISIDLHSLLIGTALLLSMIVTLFFSVFHTLGALFFNRDTAAMAYLPLSPRAHMAAKWTGIYLSELIFTLIIVLPLLIIHGIWNDASVIYFVAAVLITLVTPVYPLAVSLLLSSILGRFTSMVKNKEVWIVVGTVIMLVVVLGSEWLLLPHMPEEADDAYILQMLVDNRMLLETIIGAFPPVLWAVDGISGQLLFAILFLAVGIAVVALIIWTLGKNYLHICLRHTEHGTKAGKTKKTRGDAYAPRKPFLAVFCRELNEIFKTPTYLLNAVLGVMMMPIMLVSMSVGMTSGDEGLVLSDLLDQLLANISGVDLTLILAAIMSLMSLMCPISATAISREGKRLPIMRMIPVAPRTLLHAKLLVSMLIVGAGSVVMGVVIVAILGISYLPHAAAAVLLENVISLVVSICNITIDVLRPVLDWKNENEVMKQNMNLMIGMVISMVLIGLPVAAAIILRNAAILYRLAAVAGILVAETAFSLLLLYQVAAPRFTVLEP